MIHYPNYIHNERGIFLMKCFLLSNPADKELRCVMDCREYLQVTTLVDIISVDGKRSCYKHGKVDYTNGSSLTFRDQENLHAKI